MTSGGLTCSFVPRYTVPVPAKPRLGFVNPGGALSQNAGFGFKFFLPGLVASVKAHDNK